MEELKKIENLLNEHLKTTALKLYSIEQVREYGFNILRILVDSKDAISTDEIEKINQYISTELDQMNLFNGMEYMLEVSSAGLEKEIRNTQELRDAIGKYAFIRTKDFEQNGTIVDFKDNLIIFKINLKGRMKEINLNYDDVLFIRHAVKL